MAAAAEEIDDVPIAVIQRAKTPTPTKGRAPGNVPVEDIDDVPLAILASPQPNGSAGKGQQSGKKKPAQGKSPAGRKSADHDARWRQNLELLRPCIARDGTLDYSALDAEARARATNFVREQRRCHKKRESGEPSPLTDERVRLLAEAGFVFRQSKAKMPGTKPSKMKQSKISDLFGGAAAAPAVTEKEDDGATSAREVKWRENLALLRPCIKEGGRMDYSALDEAAKKRVQMFVNAQRKSYLAREKGEPGPLTDERFRQLSDAGFNFKPHAASKVRREEDGTADAERKTKGEAKKMTPVKKAAGGGVAATGTPNAAAGKSPARPVLPSGAAELAVPCPSIGAGWTQKLVARKSLDGASSGKSGDRYYFSPEGKKFRSMPEVQRHLAGEGEGRGTPGKPEPKPAAATAAKGASDRDAKWHENLALLRPCIKEGGMMKYSALDEGAKKRVQAFVNTQRKCYLAREKGEPTPLTEERFRLLSEAGFIFKPHAASKARREEDGTAKEAGRMAKDDTKETVAGADGGGEKVASAAASAAKGASDREAKWLENLALLRPCIKEGGKMDYSALDEAAKKRVQIFVNTQRKSYLAREKGESGPLTDERFRQLSEAGFIFKPHAASKARREEDGAADAGRKTKGQVKKTTPVKKADGVEVAATESPNAAASKSPAKPVLPSGGAELAIPCPSIGAGWTQKVVARKSLDGVSSAKRAHKDRYFFSPEGKKFRSMKEVQRHLAGEEVGRRTPGKPKPAAATAAQGTPALEAKWRENLALLRPCIKDGGKMDYSALDEGVKKRVQAFVNVQRKCYLVREKGEPTSLTDERFRLLSEAGFNFKPHAASKARRSEDGMAKEAGRMAKDDTKETVAGADGGGGAAPSAAGTAAKGASDRDTKWLDNLALLRPCIKEDGKMDYSMLNEGVKKRVVGFANTQRRDYLARERGEPTPLKDERFRLLSEAGFNFKPKAASKVRREEDGTEKEPERKAKDPSHTEKDARGAPRRDDKWLENLAMLCPCIREDGKMDYSMLDEEVKKRVVGFVGGQRRAYLAREKGEPGALTDERFRLLSEANFEFQPHARSRAKGEEGGTTTSEQKPDASIKEKGSSYVSPSKRHTVVECVERANDQTEKASSGKVKNSTPLKTTEAKVAPAPSSTSTSLSKRASISSSKRAGKPSYVDMAYDAILHLKNRKGSSIPAISKYILAHNSNVKSVSAQTFKNRLSTALKQGVKGGQFVKVKNSFKIDPEWSKKLKAAAMAKQKAAKKLQKELEKAKRAKEIAKQRELDKAKQKDEDAEKQKLIEERKRKEKLAREEKAKAAWKKKQEEMEEARRRQAEAEARRKFIQQQLRKRRYPVEDTRLHREDKEWGVTRPDDVTDRPSLPTTLSCLVPPSLRTSMPVEEDGGSVAKGYGPGDGTLPTGDHGRGLVTDAIHIYHFFCGDVGLTDSDLPVPKFSLKTLLYALDEVRSGRATAAKCLPPLLTHLFVTALSVLTAPRLGDDEESDSDDDGDELPDDVLGPAERRLQEDLSTLKEGLNVASWSQVCCFYMNLMGRYYASDTLEESALSGEAGLDMSYLWNENQMEEDGIEAGTSPHRSNLYLGDSQGLLAKSHAKLNDQIEPWSLSADELMVLLRTLTDDVLTIRPDLAEDIAGRGDKLKELLRVKRAAVLKYNKMKLGHEGPKKSARPKNPEGNGLKGKAGEKKDEPADVAKKDQPANAAEKDEPANVVTSEESEKPFVPTVTKQELLAAEKARDKAVEAYEKGLDTLITRTEPVGFDRDFNAIYFFRHDPTMLHVEQIDASLLPPEIKSLDTELTPFSSWHSIDTKPLFEQFLSSLDERGEREEEAYEVCSDLTILKRRLLDDKKKENTRAIARERAKEDLERRLENAKIARDAEDGRRSGRLAGLAQDEVKKLEEERSRMIKAHKKEEQQEKSNREAGSDYSLLTGLDMVMELFQGQRSSRSRKKVDSDITGEAALLAAAPSHQLWMEENAGGNGTLHMLAEALLALEERCNDLSPWSRKDITRRVWRKQLNDAPLAWAQDCKMQLGPSVDADEDSSALESPAKKQRVDGISGTPVDTILLCLKDLELRVFDISGKKRAAEEASEAAEMNEDASSDEEELRRRLDCWKVKINALRHIETTQNKLIRDIIAAAITVARKAHLNQVAAELKIALQLFRPTAGGEARAAAIEVLEKHGGYEGSDDEDEDIDFDELADATGDFKAENETSGDEIESMLSDEIRRIGGSVGGDEFADESDWRQAIQEAKSISRLALMIQSFVSKADIVITELVDCRDNLDSVIGLNSKRTSRKKKSIRKHDSSMHIWCNAEFSSKLVKARVQDRPWWPAHVCLPLESVISDALADSGYVLISYVGGPEMFMVPEDDIVDFAEEVEEDLSEYDTSICAQLQESMSIAKTLWRTRNPGRVTRRSKQWKHCFNDEKKTAD